MSLCTAEPRRGRRKHVSRNRKNIRTGGSTLPETHLRKNVITMTEENNKMDPKDIEYEFLYNIKDQTMLYLDMSKSNLGYAESVLLLVDEMVEKLGQDLHREVDEEEEEGEDTGSE